jgi:hypothetical protein
MLVSMGASAKVVTVPRPPALDAVALYKVQPPAPFIDKAKLQALSPNLQKLLAHINDAPSEIDASGVLSSLLALLPAGKAVAADPFDGLSPKIPIVEYAVNGATRWAFALGRVDEVSSAPAGLGAELPAAGYPSVAVRLLGAVADLPGIPTPQGLVELAAGRWTADQIAGARLLISTGSVNPKATFGVPVDQITVRSPIMQIRRPTPLADPIDSALWSPSKGSPSPSSAVGAPFTLSGGRFQRPAQASDPMVGPYGKMSRLDASAHATALASVASLAINATGGAFPDVQLAISALDANGDIVPGLVAADFAVMDDGHQQYPALLSNDVLPDPRVTLAYDCSGSIAWPTPEDRSAFDERLATAFTTAAASGEYRLGVAPLGSGPADGYIVPDATKIRYAVSHCVSESPIWYAIAELAPRDGVSALVIVSDFVGDDDPAAIPALKKRAAATGLPIALVPVSSTVDQSLIAELTQSLGAIVLDHTATDFQQQLTDFLSSTVKQLRASVYRSSYHLPADEQMNESSRRVEVALVARPSVTASATYTPPPPTSRGRLGFAGLYVEIGIGGQTAVRRVCGAQLSRFGSPVSATPADYDDTRALLDGLITIAFEPGSPTTGQNLEDVIRASLSVEPLLKALGKDPQSLDEIVASAGAIEYYNSAVSLLVDRQGEARGTAVVAPESMRVIIATEFVANGRMNGNTGIVPQANRCVAGTKDAASAFRDVLRSSIGLSLRESLAMQTSAARLLSGLPLQYLAPTADPATSSGYSASDVARWRHIFDEYGDAHIFIPKDASVPAAWIVDVRTGSAVAVLIDGSGGAQTCEQWKTNAPIQAVLGLLQMAASLVAVECEDPFIGFACIGASVTGVGAATVATFAGLVLNGFSPADALLMAVAFLQLGIPGWKNVGLTLLGVLWSLYSQGSSDPCGPR